MTCDTIIVSDVHLGSPLAMARELRRLLKTTKFKRLILLGDIFSDLNFARLTSEHWKLIALIRKLSHPKHNIEVVWIEGNHDAGVTEVMRHLLGVRVYLKYTWDWNGKKCVAMHGHQFDGIYAGGNPWFNGVITELHILLQKIKFVRSWLPRLLDRFSTHYQRLTDKVADGALTLATDLEASYIFCGHTHAPHHVIRDSVEYWNSGCWVGGVATYLTIGENVESHVYSL